jgi:hypothetical protein
LKEGLGVEVDLRMLVIGWILDCSICVLKIVSSLDYTALFEFVNYSLLNERSRDYFTEIVDFS